ncbi:hypothetical protein [Nocardia jiangxiensis]|uniref:Uncharacterized protein n=1 Tax=Nocardia jiangxiensis TaxID=282685 RepID=A0ABW6RQP3_9NOCA|nr:hypothetical protein [Nocardia jiangxiensis]
MSGWIAVGFVVATAPPAAVLAAALLLPEKTDPSRPAGAIPGRAQNDDHRRNATFGDDEPG